MKLEIAVIDDGVSKETITDLLFNLEYRDGSIRECKSAISCYSHGSICSAIIRKYVPDARVGSIRVLGSDKSGEATALLSAIQWCVERDIKILNLSLGSVEACDIPAMSKVVKEAYNKGCILVAACKNGRNTSYPASLMNVLGVRLDTSLKGFAYSVNPFPNGGVELSASADHEVFLSSDATTYNTQMFNSYASPVITAAVYELLATGKCERSFEDVRGSLYRNAGFGTPKSISHSRITSHFERIPCNNTVPIVAFVGNGAYQLMIDIASRFLRDNYLPLIFTQYADSLSPYCVHINDDTLLNGFCFAMAEFYGADLILACVQEDATSRISHDVIVIDWSLHRKIGNDISNIITYTDRVEQDDVYNRLTSILT